MIWRAPALCLAFAACSACSFSHRKIPLPEGAILAKKIPVFPMERMERDGTGTPVVVPDGRYNYTAKTAVSDRGETVLLDPDEDPSLAADFSAPLAAYFRALPQAWDRINGVLAPDNYPQADRLLRVGSAGAEKQPVVLLHGLGASPHTWRRLSAHLLGSETFRARYQLWHYRYPTGASLEANAGRFKNDIHRAFADHQKRPILIGHSMGGILALAAASDPETSGRVASAILLACPARGNWFATLPQAQIASSLHGVADLASTSKFIQELVEFQPHNDLPIHIILGRHQTFPDGSFTDGIVRSTDAYPSPTTTFIVPAHGHQIHKRDDVIGIIGKLLELEN